MDSCSSLTSSECHGFSTDHSSRSIELCLILYYVSDVTCRELLGDKFAVGEVSQLSGHEHSQNTQGLMVHRGLSKRATNNQFPLLTWITFHKIPQTNQTKITKAKVLPLEFLPFVKVYLLYSENPVNRVVSHDLEHLSLAANSPWKAKSTQIPSYFWYILWFYFIPSYTHLTLLKGLA